jgi:hypothetical protein
MKKSPFAKKLLAGTSVRTGKEKKADLLRWLGAWDFLPPEQEQQLPAAPASPLPSPPAGLLKRLSHEIERLSKEKN